VQKQRIFISATKAARILRHNKVLYQSVSNKLGTQITTEFFYPDQRILTTVTTERTTEISRCRNAAMSIRAGF
jgi:hypothetical protein